MPHQFKRFGFAIIVATVALSFVFDTGTRQSLFRRPATANAGSITVNVSTGWEVSSNTASATNVTYTHRFTVETAIKSGDEVRIGIMQPPGPFTPMPNFFGATLASGTTAGLSGQTMNVFFAGSAVHLSVLANANITAGSTVTLVMSGVNNPSILGNFPTNTATLRNGAALDGNAFSPDANGKLTVGTVKLSGNIKGDTNGDGIGDVNLAGVRLEIHPGPGSTTFGFWTATTDSSGNYGFAGITNGTYIFEKSQGIDPNSSQASTVSQYSNFEPISVTITDTPQTINKVLKKSQKKIIGKVLRKGLGTAVKGAMVNAGSMGGGFANTQSGTDGTFQLTMAATGQVFFMVQPNVFGPPPGGGGPLPTNDTDFGSVQRQLAFVKPAADAETIDLGNVEVEVASATLSFCLKNPDGSAASGGAGVMDFKRHNFTPSQLDSSGCANVKLVPGGVVKIDSFDPNGSYSMPNVQTLVKKGANNLGNIVKLANNKTITVTAKRIDGGSERPVANAMAMVFSKDPGPPYFATTNSSGVATVKVPTGFEGRAGVMPGSNFGGGPKGGGSGGGGPSVFWRSLWALEPALAQSLGNSGGDDGQLFPVTGFQKVKAGDSVVAKFDKADKQIQVRTVNGDGVLITEGAFVNIRPVSGSVGAQFGCPTAGGVGTCNVIAGDLEGRVMFPPDAGYVGKAKKFTIADSGTTVSLEVAPKNATISGKIKKGDGTVIADPNLAVQVGAFGDAFSFGKYNPSTGDYSIAVSAGKWRVGAMADRPGDGGYVPSINPKEISVAANETATFDITLAQLNAKIKGKVTKTDGSAVEGVTVVANNTLTDVIRDNEAPGVGGPGPGPGPGGEGPEFAQTSVTDENGDYEIPVVPGDKYTVVVNADSLNLFPTSISQAEPKANETATVNITLSPADMTLKITGDQSSGGRLDGGKATIFSENGLISLQSELSSSGEATVSLPSQDSKGNAMVYFVSVGKDSPEDNKRDKSDDVKIIGQKDATVSSTLKTNSDTNLAKPTTVEVSSSSSAAATLNQGTTEKASISLPAGALGSDSGSSSGGNSVLSLTPIDAELPKTKTDTPVDAGLDITVTDSSGNGTTQLQGVATVEIHYDPTKLPSGVSESNLVMKAYNESTKQYEQLQSSDVDTTNNVVRATTNHFTQFAVVATTDTTAPGAPTGISATDLGTNGKVKLAWTNPTDSDLKSLTIYRSTTSGSLGTAVHTGVTGTSKEDTGLTNGTTYYYTVRAVDSSGNESSNTAQVSAAPTSSKLPKTGTPSTSFLGLAAIFSLTGLVLLLGYAISLRQTRR